MRWPTPQAADPAESELRRRFFAAISDDDLDALMGLLELTSDGLLLSQTKRTPLPSWADPIIERIITRTAERMNSKESEAEKREPIQTDAPSDFASLLSKRWHKANALTRERLRSIAKALGIETPAEPMRRLRPPRVKTTEQPTSASAHAGISTQKPAQEVARNAAKRSQSDISEPASESLFADEIEPRSTPQANPYWTTGEGAWS